jgi:hypothetical protein
MEERKLLPDFAKGMAVLCMIQVHVMELLARPEILNCYCGKASLFLGGPSAAPVFMAVLGYFAISSSKTIRQQLFRGIKLLMLGLGLNVALNLNALIHIFCFGLNANPFSLIFGADILFLAGFAVILIAILKLIFRQQFILYFLLAIFITLLPMFFGYPQYVGVRAYFQAFIFSDVAWSYFPLVPWLAYPLIGAGTYLLMKSQVINKLTAKARMAAAGIFIVILAATAYLAIPQIIQLHLYYHHNVLLFSWIALFMIVWFTALNKIMQLKGKNLLTQFIAFTGRNVTAFYVIQWIFIGNSATVLYKDQGTLSLLLFMTATTILTGLMVYAYNKIKGSRKKDIVL